MDGFIILIGMMGSGKSAVGRQLAAILQVPFVDTDTLLQNRFGRPVADIFATYGEEAFRGHETSILKSLERQPGILSTGGGIVMRDANWEQLRRLGTTIYLDVPVELLADRLERSHKKRPLLMVEDWPKKLESIQVSRREQYDRCDYKVGLGEDTIEDAARKVLTVLGVEA